MTDPTAYPAGLASVQVESICSSRSAKILRGVKWLQDERDFVYVLNGRRIMGSLGSSRIANGSKANPHRATEGEEDCAARPIKSTELSRKQSDALCQCSWQHCKITIQGGIYANHYNEKTEQPFTTRTGEKVSP